MTEINPLVHTALSDDEILARVPNSIFILYEDICHVPSLKALLPTGKKLLILYELAKTGHFCCLFENQEGLQFFDPLGGRPDSELKHVSPQYISKNQDYPYLLNLLKQSQRPIIYNQHHLQKHHTSTCGHWCTIRMLASHLTCDQFAECFEGVQDKDLIVASLYYGGFTPR